MSLIMTECAYYKQLLPYTHNEHREYFHNENITWFHLDDSWVDRRRRKNTKITLVSKFRMEIYIISYFSIIIYE